MRVESKIALIDTFSFPPLKQGLFQINSQPIGAKITLCIRALMLPALEQYPLLF
jgi:hypothetical protein